MASISVEAFNAVQDLYPKVLVDRTADPIGLNYYSFRSVIEELAFIEKLTGFIPEFDAETVERAYCGASDAFRAQMVSQLPYFSVLAPGVTDDALFRDLPPRENSFEDWENPNFDVMARNLNDYISGLARVI